MPRVRARAQDRSILRALPGLALVLWLAGGCAATGEVRGRLVAPAPPAASGLGARAGAAAGISMAEAVIYVLPADVAQRRLPARARASESDSAQVDLTASGFEPQVLAVARGTTVRFRNRDHVYHLPFSVSPAARFDLEACAPGQTRSVTFDSVGAVHLFCELHPGAAGFVMVLPDRLYVRPRSNGRFQLRKLSPGPYTVRAWHPVYGEAACRVEVERGRPALVELSF